MGDYQWTSTSPLHIGYWYWYQTASPPSRPGHNSEQWCAICTTHCRKGHIYEIQNWMGPTHFPNPRPETHDDTMEIIDPLWTWLLLPVMESPPGWPHPITWNFSTLISLEITWNVSQINFNAKSSEYPQNPLKWYRTFAGHLLLSINLGSSIRCPSMCITLQNVTWIPSNPSCITSYDKSWTSHWFQTILPRDSVAQIASLTGPKMPNWMNNWKSPHLALRRAPQRWLSTVASANRVGAHTK